MSSLIDALVVAAIVMNGLLAGLFFVFACAITPGFGRVDDATYVQAFRAINRAIVNGWFLLVFFTAPLTALAYAFLGTRSAAIVPTSWAWAGAACAALTLIITAVRNVPLNTQLDRAATRTQVEYRVARERFEALWNRWNLTRTITSAGALVSLVLAGALG
ncbi:DUF1772 domain-containing protein [Brachybacterium sp. UMB0905]|uniref:anthrone oxygenase family protein n=1 Tax=Brachybacterium sp. UMB0905 TaxID=2069310 RepID=UPI001E48C627|nr:anthrone oxygenase family protein [Brachybacterium sp. UMB0905]